MKVLPDPSWPPSFFPPAPGVSEVHPRLRSPFPRLPLPFPLLLQPQGLAAPTLPSVCHSRGSPHLELSSVSCCQEPSLFETPFQTRDYQKPSSHLVSLQLFLAIRFLLRIVFLPASACSGAGKPHVRSLRCRNAVTACPSPRRSGLEKRAPRRLRVGGTAP